MFTGTSSYEDVLDPLDGGLAADLADRVRERNVLGTRLDAVLGVAAGGDTAGTHEGVETLVRVQLARRMEVHEEPQPSSRQLASHAGAETRSPSVVIGFVRISISAESTLCCGRQAIAKLCQYGARSGPSCRFTRISIVRRSGMRLGGVRHVVLPWPRRDERHVDRLVRELRAVRRPARLRGLEPPRIVAIRELGFVVRAAALVPPERADRDDTGQL